MTPDTMNYMIAGFVVILVGIVGYLISLRVRIVRLSMKRRKGNVRDD